MRGGDRGPEGGSDHPEDNNPEDVKPRENPEIYPEEKPDNISLNPENQKLRDDIQDLLDNPREIPEAFPEKDPDRIALSPENKVLRDEIQVL